MFRIMVCTLCCGLAQSALAEPLIDNLSEPAVPTATLIFRDGSGSFDASQSFITDTRRHTLDSIETNLGARLGSPAIRAELRDGPLPTGALLATFDVDIPVGPPELLTLVPSTPVTLEPNSSYVLILAVADLGSFEWPYAETTVWTGPGFFSDYFYSTDDAPWVNFGNERPYLMRVNVTPVPCYANCDDSTTTVLSPADFTCFLAKYRAGDPYANCDNSSAPDFSPADFTCFLTKYRAGCP